MNDLLAIAYGAGLKDGLNPCIFMTCAIVIAHGLWLREKPIKLFFIRFVFCLIYFVGTLVLNFGPGQVIILQKNFVFASKILYFILGLWAFIFGIIFFKEWLVLYRNSSAEKLVDEKTRISNWIIWPGTIILSILLCAMASFWPIDKYILLLGNEALIKGQWHTASFLLLNYDLFSLWALWFIWIIFSIKEIQPSVIRITSSAVFFTASSILIFLFK